jgi:hypothetical protein
MGILPRIIVFYNINYLLLIVGECVIENVEKLRQAVNSNLSDAIDRESRLGMRYTVGKSIIIVVVTLFALVATRKIYRFVRLGIPITLSRPTEPSLAEFHKSASFPIVFNEGNSEAAYDYKNLVELFAECDGIKQDFYNNFTPHFARKKELDPEKMQELLERLYCERARFSQYVAELKGRSQRGISIKKRRSLVYYQGVIQQHIDTLERIKKTQLSCTGPVLQNPEATQP